MWNTSDEKFVVCERIIKNCDTAPSFIGISFVRIICFERSVTDSVIFTDFVLLIFLKMKKNLCTDTQLSQTCVHRHKVLTDLCVISKENKLSMHRCTVVTDFCVTDEETKIMYTDTVLIELLCY